MVPCVFTQQRASPERSQNGSMGGQGWCGQFVITWQDCLSLLQGFMESADVLHMLFVAWCLASCGTASIRNKWGQNKFPTNEKTNNKFVTTNKSPSWHGTANLSPLPQFWLHRLNCLDYNYLLNNSVFSLIHSPFINSLSDFLKTQNWNNNNNNIYGVLIMCQALF